MPLLDHFHPPLFPSRPWESFHSRWANSIADSLNATLPERYTAEVQIHLGSQVEADVVEFERGLHEEGDAGGIATRTWTPPKATLTLSLPLPDVFGVEVRDQLDDARVVAVVELVSPRNKDRAESRRAFAGKSLAYLASGIGLVIVDIVTNRRASLHEKLLALLGPRDPQNSSPALYAAAYHPLRRHEENLADIWLNPLEVGQSLPTVPLALKGAGIHPLELESTYQDACHRSRL